MVRARGILDGGVIRLRDPVDLPSGTEVDMTIQPAQRDPEVERRAQAVRRILGRSPVDIRPLTVRDLIEYGRER